MKKRWPYRERGLNKMEAQFGNKAVQKFINARLKTQKTVRILEIGFGEGKCLLDLRRRFPGKNVMLYGISDKRKCGMHRQGDFLANAEKFGIIIPNSNLPKPYFYDAGRGLRFSSAYFDAIVSQVSFHYVGNKAKLIEDVWRVLKPGGRAFIHADTSDNEKYPDFMKLNLETPRFIIYQGKKMIRLSAYLRQLRKKGFDILLKNAVNKSSRRILLITKNKAEKLNLRLKYDENSTLDLKRIRNTDKYKTDSSVWWGTRSVFHTI
jgi:ubiquinone/menaquinone biosynthesis C-methylase UbiE